MTPLTHGKVDVIIRKCTKGEHAGKITLIYNTADYYSKSTTIVHLNTRTGYTHEQMSLKSVRYYYSHKRFGKSVPFDEQLIWLRKYCNYHRMDYKHFRLVNNFSRPVIGMFELDLHRPVKLKSEGGF